MADMTSAKQELHFNAHDMRAVIKAAIFTPTKDGWGLPLLFWGMPGVAKTALINGVCREYGIFCQTLSPGEMGEAAFGATPCAMTIKDKVFMGYPPPAWLSDVEAEPGGRALVFIDELNTAMGSARPALLGMLDRRIAGTRFSKAVRVLGASNPVELSAEGQEIPCPVANRLGHITWAPPTQAAWEDWLMGVDTLDEAPIELKSAELEETRVLAEWGAAFSNARAAVIGYQQFKKQLYNLPDANSPQLFKAWESPRTYYLMALAKASAAVHRLSTQDGLALQAAFVGASPVAELIQWEAQNNLPKAEDILDQKVKFEHDARRMGITRVVLNAATAIVCDKNTENRVQRTAVLWELLAQIMETAGQDFVIKPAAMLSKAPKAQDKQNRTVDLFDLKEARTVTVPLRDILIASGHDRKR
jgi:MoxR-like ATPase